MQGYTGRCWLSEGIGCSQKYYAEQDKLRGDWLSGAKSAWADYADSAGDAYGQMKSVAASTFDGMTQNLANMLTTGKAKWADFTRSTLSMLAQILSNRRAWGSSEQLALLLGLLVVGIPVPAGNMSLLVWYTAVSLSLTKNPPHGLAWVISTE
jgi:lambda family phage tail tape measure protein